MVISDEQRRLNRQLHQSNGQFGNRKDGNGVAQNLPAALVRLHEVGACNSFLDYGTGKGLLVERLREEVDSRIKINGYDPAVEKWEKRPEKASDILCCLDVLEHIEIDTIDEVLKDIKSLTKNFCYLVIDLQPAAKTLSDGRNAHILLAPSDWWVSKISQLFSSQVNFVLPHRRGLPQKLAIFATNRNECIAPMMAFCMKLKIFDQDFNGGPLGNIKR